jgi:hypothetical protein
MLYVTESHIIILKSSLALAKSPLFKTITLRTQSEWPVSIIVLFQGEIDVVTVVDSVVVCGQIV